jgi:UDP-N-acetylmuramoyl-L-alanyl-D-glutamate--2,6-diaminopimelate ligase
LLDSGLEFSLIHRGKTLNLALPFWGDFQAANATLAASIAFSLGISTEKIQEGLKKCAMIPGRLECVAKTPRKVFVDYAHTPDALGSLLTTVRKFTKGKIVLVFGCAGDRDKMKRPIMGQIAHALADIIIITDDNPRTEDPTSIRREVMQGLNHHQAAYNIADRALAIRHALNCSHDDDVIVIAGKGHENYQIYGTMTHVFSDVDEVRKVMGL